MDCTYVAPPIIEGHPLVGREVKYSFEPYNQGYGEIVEIRQRPNENRITVTIKVIEGTETARLFQYSSSKSNAGRTLTAYGVSEAALTEAVEGAWTFRYIYPL